MDEVFKEYEQTGYEVSNLGNVRSVDGKPCRVYHSGKAVVVSLRGKDGLPHVRRVARMVLACFADVPSSKRISVGYKDDNPQNVRLDNLVVGRVATTIDPKPVYQFSFQGELQRVHESLASCAAKIGVTIQRLSNICRAKGGFYHGSVFQYSATFDASHLQPARIRRTRTGTIFQYDLDGRLLRSHRDIEEVRELLRGADPTPIYRVIAGEERCAFGFIWSDKRHPNILAHQRQQFRFVLKDLDGNVLKTANSLAEAEREFGMNRCTIYEFLDGKKNYHRPVRVEKEYQFADGSTKPTGDHDL